MTESSWGRILVLFLFMSLTWLWSVKSVKLILSRGISREGNGTPLQHSCLENPMDGGAWWAAVHGVAKSRIWLSGFTFMHWRRKWQPTPEFSPRESRGLRSLVGFHLWGHTESDTTEQLAHNTHSLSYSIVSSVSLHFSLTTRSSYFSLLFFGILHSVGYVLPFILCFWLLFISQLFVWPPKTTILPSCISFPLVWFLSSPPVQCYEPLSIVI